MVDKHLQNFINLIRTKYIATGSDHVPMDLARKSSFFTMDVITDIAFGDPWGCLIHDDDVYKWFASMELQLPSAMRASTLPWLADLFAIPVLAKFVMPSENDPIGAGKLLRIAKDIVQKRFDEENPGAKRDMMGSFIRHGVTRTEAVSEATLQM
jgi:hypothetical protein